MLGSAAEETEKMNEIPWPLFMSSKLSWITWFWGNRSPDRWKLFFVRNVFTSFNVKDIRIFFPWFCCICPWRILTIRLLQSAVSWIVTIYCEVCSCCPETWGTSSFHCGQHWLLANILPVQWCVQPYTVLRFCSPRTAHSGRAPTLHSKSKTEPTGK